MLASACVLSVTASTEVLADETYPAPVPTPVAAAPDDLSGHLILAPRAAYVVPMGSADSVLKQRGYTASGFGAGLDISFGLSRYVAVQGRFDMGWFGAGSQCPTGGSCSASMWASGLGIEYHMVNGGAFDPWLRYGVGYRSTTFDRKWPGRTGPNSGTYGGIEWLHLAIGGEWYGLKTIGFGPYVAFDLGGYNSRPSESSQMGASSTFHSFLSVGIRGVFHPAR